MTQQKRLTQWANGQVSGLATAINNRTQLVSIICDRINNPDKQTNESNEELKLSLLDVLWEIEGIVASQLVGVSNVIRELEDSDDWDV